MCYRSFLLDGLGGGYGEAGQVNNPHALALSESDQEERHVTCAGGAEPGCSPPWDGGQGPLPPCWGAQPAPQRH